MTTWSLSLPIDSKTAAACTANHRAGSHHVKTAAVKQVRTDVLALIGHRAGEPPRFDHVEISVTLMQRTKRRRDPDNVAGIAKPVLDTIVDAGLLPDDSWKHVARVCYTILSGDLTVPKNCVRLTVELTEVPRTDTEATP
jgi:Holliday junction resolvase RusA-like endonuclease